MVKCAVTNIKGDSSEFYKVGKKWFKDKETYIRYLESNDVTYNDVLELLVEDKNSIVSLNAKTKILKIIINDFTNKC